MAIHQPAATSMAAHAAVSCQMRFHHDTGAAIRYTSPNAGSTSSACNILARNPKPTIENADRSHHVLPRSSARIMAYAPTTSRSTSAASGLLKRNINAATGVSASAVPASRADPAENQRRTARYSTPTAATPSSASGTRMLHEFTPKTRAVNAIGHSDNGDLSTVTAFDASNEPKKNAFQLLVAACTAAE